MYSTVKLLFVLSLLAIFSLKFCPPVHAKIGLSFTQPPSEIHSDQSLDLSVTISGADETSEYYIRGVFYKPDTSQYFGFTKNNDSNWQTETQSFTQFYKIKGNTTATITFKPDTGSPYFSKDTSYLFKIGRYTPGGSFTWTEQSSATILLSAQKEITLTPTSTVTQPLTGTITPTSSPTATVTLTPTPTVTPHISPLADFSPNTIVLSEIMACPSSGQSEWIEIKNQTASVLTLTNWKLKDSSDTHQLTINDSIGSYGYLVVSLNSSMFNNSGDTVRIHSGNGTLIDQMSYTSCSSGASFIKVNDQWQMTKHPTQNETNAYESFVSNTPKPTSTSILKDDLRHEEIETDSDEVVKLSSAVTKRIFDSEVDEGSAEPQVNDINETETTHESSPTMKTISVLEAEPLVSFISQSTAFLLGGCSYILTAALLAQKWYTLTSA